MKKRLIALGLTAAMAAAMVGCGSADADKKAEETPSTEETTTTADGKTYNIGVCQLLQHPALDAATEGFQAALTEKLGDAVTFDVQNASGESANCATIVNGFVSSDVDLILANATAPLQAAASATADIPVLGTSVTDYATALEITDWTGVVGNNISGTSDLAPLDQQAEMLKELFPDAKKVGLLYCSAEANSVYQCTVIEGYLKDYGYDVTWYAFTDTNDVASLAKKAADHLYEELMKHKVEVIYDDREGVRPGAMFSDADLIGAPIRVVVSPRNLKENVVEITTRDKSLQETVPMNQVMEYIWNLRDKLYKEL